jgi:hypothetical protein
MVAADPVELPTTRRRLRPLTVLLLCAAAVLVLAVAGVGVGYLISEHKDPFANGPLHWTLTGNEYRIYSVGPNGVDDGGAVGETSEQGDVVIRGRRN